MLSFKIYLLSLHRFKKFTMRTVDKQHQDSITPQLAGAMYEVESGKVQFYEETKIIN